MSRAPLGAVVALTYDGFAPLELEHVLRTPSGRCYVVLEARRQVRGKHRGRWHLRCLVAGEPPPGAIVHPLHWYPRLARRR